MYSKALVVLLLLRCLQTKCQCVKGLSVDISDGAQLAEGIIDYNGYKFSQQDYFRDNITGLIMGCICNKRICARKCCPQGTGYDPKLRLCVKLDVEFQPPLWNTGGYRIVKKKASDYFNWLYGRPNCTRLQLSKAYVEYKLEMDGSIYVETPNSIPPWTLFTPDRYCVDNFVTNTTGTPVTRLDALICFPEEQEENNYWLSSICMLVSIFFIMLTVSVYACIPELRNLHGRVLMAYLICLAIGFLVLASMKIMLVTASMYQSLCLIFTFIIYYFLEAAFFWLNVMCFDIWWTFSGKRGLSLEKLSWRGRFYAYAFYAFGVPLVLLVILASLEFSDLPPHPALPLLKQGGCFFGRSRIIYLYGPMLILFIANITFFIMTACKISSIDHQSSVLKSKESATHDQQNKDKQRFLLYIKLFMVMGLNWILEVISALYTGWKVLWTITDTYNVLIGLIIFIIFVCKRKTFRLIKKRYQQLRGKPMSRAPTTVTSRTSSSRDFRMSTIKN